MMSLDQLKARRKVLVANLDDVTEKWERLSLERHRLATDLHNLNIEIQVAYMREIDALRPKKVRFKYEDIRTV
jgi:hypothetical protein